MIAPQSLLVCPLRHATESSPATRRSTGLSAPVDRKHIGRPETLCRSTGRKTPEQPVSAFNTTVPSRSTGLFLSVDRKHIGRPETLCRSTGKAFPKTPLQPLKDHSGPVDRTSSAGRPVATQSHRITWFWPGTPRLTPLSLYHS